MGQAGWLTSRGLVATDDLTREEAIELLHKLAEAERRRDAAAENFRRD
jgi:hypothetical protein